MARITRQIANGRRQSERIAPTVEATAVELPVAHVDVQAPPQPAAVPGQRPKRWYQKKSRVPLVISIVALFGPFFTAVIGPAVNSPQPDVSTCVQQLQDINELYRGNPDAVASWNVSGTSLDNACHVQSYINGLIASNESSPPDK